MKHRVIVSSNQPCEFSPKFHLRVFEHTLNEALGRENLTHAYSVCVNAVSTEEVQRLNRESRGKDKATDVLSFPNFSSFELFHADPSGYIEIGELILSCDIIRKQAEEDGVSFEREYVFILSHGFLHLLGFDHSERMFAIQDILCDRLTTS